MLYYIYIYIYTTLYRCCTLIIKQRVAQFQHFDGVHCASTVSRRAEDVKAFAVGSFAQSPNSGQASKHKRQVHDISAPVSTRHRNEWTDNRFHLHEFLHQHLAPSSQSQLSLLKPFAFSYQPPSSSFLLPRMFSRQFCSECAGRFVSNCQAWNLSGRQLHLLQTD